MSTGAAVPKRPARQQVDAPVTGHEEVHAAGTVNIWTGRVLREYRKPKEGRKKEVSAYRCHPKLDSGLTRGDGSGQLYCCLYFARGICHHGADCSYLHRVPTEKDEQRHRTDYSHDIFGRERGTLKNDGRKKGVGSYERECKTLYVHYGGAGTLPTDQLRTLITENFAEWGPLEDVHVVPAKAIAFVRYNWRASAEFAKAAMHQQTLRGCDTTEVLDVRWANDDPNPRAVARVQHEREEALRDAYVRAVSELPPDAKRARIQQLHLAATTRPGIASAAYPDTDAQYGGGGGYQHHYEGWDTFAYEQQLQQQEQEDVEQDEDAQYEAWRQWQQQHPAGHYPGSVGVHDDWTRYLRPEDHYREQMAAQQQAYAQLEAGHAAAAAPGPAAQQGGPGEGGDQRSQGVGEAAAEEALGLIAGYGSGSDSEEEGGAERAAQASG